MKTSDLFKMGLRNLTRRKARTMLTVIGVIIGTLSIMIMRSIGIGMNTNFEKQVMQRGGLTTITVNSNADIITEDGQWGGSQKQKLNDDVIKQFQAIKYVRAVSPVIRKSATLYSGKNQTWANISAIDSSTYGDFDFPNLQFGEYPNEEDNTAIIFGAQMPWEFYDPYSRYSPPIKVDLQKDKLTLKFQDYSIGEKKKEFTLPLKNIAKMEVTNSDFDYNIYMDLNYFKTIYRKYCNTLSLQDRKRALTGLSEYQEIMVNTVNIDKVLEVQDKIKELGFQSFSMLQYLKPLMEASDTLQLVLGALGAVAMLVSAISIANTMVMSIYERTKEIGIMKVLGCTIKDIRKLFLFEAGMIGLIGGISGVALGYLTSWGINKFGQPLFKALLSGNYMYDLENASFSIIPIWLPLASIGIAICIGLVSGYFPARRATKISAIEAMKTEG